MEEYSENQSLFDKKADDLTVADNIKIFTGLMAISVMVPVAIAGAAVGAEKFADWLRVRKFRQELEQAELEESEEV